MPFFVGLDGEMTNRIGEEGELCQIGLAIESGETYGSDIRCALINPDPEAMAVHRIDPGWLKEGAPERRKVDNDAAYWLRSAMQPSGASSAVPVGWGVSYFDMPFIRKFLPRLAGCLSNRSVELGSVCYSVGATFRMSPDTLKRKAKRYAEAKMEKAGKDARWHNAEYDAQAALCSWEYLMLVMREGVYPNWNLSEV